MTRRTGAKKTKSCLSFAHSFAPSRLRGFRGRPDYNPIMCGRYTLIRLADFTDMFPWIRPPREDPPDRYNIAPTQPIAAVPNAAEPQVEFFHWGFIPYWAKDASIGNRMINARAETIATKPIFRNALQRRRCLIPASGFYEWKKNPNGTKTPMYIRMKDLKPFAFAGLWERWRSPDGSEVRSCTIITGKPNNLVRDIHDRMPLILPGESYRRWLEPGEVPAEQFEQMLAPYDAAAMEAYPVSRMVNNAKVESPQCIESVTADDAAAPVPDAKAKPSSRARRARTDSDEATLF
jgi:putative SOS response-associated peptidase YedK